MAKSSVPSAASSSSASPVSGAAAALPLPATYEAGLKELEALLDGLESGQLPLEELLGSYQRGAQLLTFCRSKLEAVENQIKVLDGGELKPWSRS
jgi:exodeoxyribonuclease VII small subunit